MMISTRGRYALRILVDLAENRKDGYITLREAAERQEISEKYLESIVKDLVRGKFVEGVRGKGGGYRLARPAGDMNVLDVRGSGSRSLSRGGRQSLHPCGCLQDASSLGRSEPGRQRVSERLHGAGSCPGPRRRISHKAI